MASGAKRHTGVVGLAVMGENLALNIERNGFPVGVYNRTWVKTQDFMVDRAKGLDIVASETVKGFVESLDKPRHIILLVKAGAPVDDVLAELSEFIDPDDIVIDGGNSFFHDTERRGKQWAGKFHYVGMGVSGGEEGALWGPSLMPGGPKDAYSVLEPMLVDISAKSKAGACVTYIGPGGSGHYVKMVHNGIEYADMQLIAETYDIMRRSLGMSAAEIGQVFERWNKGKLESYLIEITGQVLGVTDTETGRALVDEILDTAAQKGTGQWTSQNALELGTPVPTIDAAVAARMMSSRKEQRVAASAKLTGPKIEVADSKKERDALIDHMENALYFAKISSYAQGMALLQTASTDYQWNLNLSEIARIWMAGCIIRAELLDPIRAAFKDDPGLVNLLMAPHITKAVNDSSPSARLVVEMAVRHGIPVPGFTSALNYVDTYRTENLPANLIQALRDNFGAHTYQRLDKSGVFHTNWSTGETETIG